MAIIGAGKVTAIGEDTAVPKARDGQIYSQAGQAISPREVPPEGSAYWPQVLTNQPNFYGTSSLFASSQPKLAKSQGSEVFLPNNHSLIFRFASPVCLTCYLSAINASTASAGPKTLAISTCKCASDKNLGLQLSPGHRRHYREVDKARPNFTTGKCQTPDRLTIRPPKNRPAQIKTLAIIGAGKVTAIGEDTAVPKARDGQIYSQAGQAISPREVPPEGSAYWPQVLTTNQTFTVQAHCLHQANQSWQSLKAQKCSFRIITALFFVSLPHMLSVCYQRFDSQRWAQDAGNLNVQVCLRQKPRFATQPGSPPTLQRGR